MREPFHKVIVDQIHLVPSFDGSLELIGLILRNVFIPEGHDQIIEAWRKRCERTSPPPPNYEEVLADLIAHKKEVEGEKKEPKPRSLFAAQIQARLDGYRLRNPEKSEFLSSWVDELELSVRAYNVLKENDVRTFGELILVKDLLRAGKLKGLGRATQLELRKIADFIEERSK